METTNATEALLSQPFFQETAAHHKIAQTIKIIQSHGEQVDALINGLPVNALLHCVSMLVVVFEKFTFDLQILALPKGAVLLATSSTAPFEAWSFGPNILALQGHCEFDAKTTLEKIHAPLTNNGYDDKSMANVSRMILGKTLHTS